MDCLKSILSLTRAQTEAISEEGMDGLQSLIDQSRVKLMNQRFGRRIQCVFYGAEAKAWCKSLDEAGTLGIKGVKELQSLVSKIMGLLKEISEVERSNKEKANSLLSFLGAKIREIREGRKVSSAYSPAASLSPPSYFIDQKK